MSSATLIHNSRGKRIGSAPRDTRHGRIRLLIALVGTAAASAPPPAQAAEARTPCTAEWDIKITPGLGLTPGHGSYGTDGQSGILTCRGSVAGRHVTGPGRWGVSGTYGTAEEADDCFGVHGPIEFTFTIPTEGGPQQGKTLGSFDYGPRYGRPPTGGVMRTARASGSYSFTPLQGDCITSPLTVGHLRFDFPLTD
jgi:hypothetical protein